MHATLRTIFEVIHDTECLMREYGASTVRQSYLLHVPYHIEAELEDPTYLSSMGGELQAAIIVKGVHQALTDAGGTIFGYRVVWGAEALKLVHADGADVTRESLEKFRSARRDAGRTVTIDKKAAVPPSTTVSEATFKGTEDKGGVGGRLIQEALERTLQTPSGTEKCVKYAISYVRDLVRDGTPLKPGDSSWANCERTLETAKKLNLECAELELLMKQYQHNAEKDADND